MMEPLPHALLELGEDPRLDDVRKRGLEVHERDERPAAREFERALHRGVSAADHDGVPLERFVSLVKLVRHVRQSSPGTPSRLGDAK